MFTYDLTVYFNIYIYKINASYLTWTLFSWFYEFKSFSLNAQKVRIVTLKFKSMSNASLETLPKWAYSGLLPQPLHCQNLPFSHCPIADADFGSLEGIRHWMRSGNIGNERWVSVPPGQQRALWPHDPRGRSSPRGCNAPLVRVYSIYLFIIS